MFFRTERHQLRRCDLPMGKCTKVAGRARKMPAHRRQIAISASGGNGSGSERSPLAPRIDRCLDKKMEFQTASVSNIKHQVKLVNLIAFQDYHTDHLSL
ncbi:hypothetical protein T01_14742 [Trichinella spiralis]|uniref:Uncharacterized protein n=1 Tax=Trichinella spiralis TaxID=6334 RepID=A0A0V1BSI6_TRISP|nr:hypothetical protein T01_14742 [Trichinella spiralis]